MVSWAVDPSSNLLALTLVCQLEKKRLEFELLRAQREKFESEMRRIELQQKKDAQEIAEMTAALTSRIPDGRDSETTTPGEHLDSGFASPFPGPKLASSSTMMPPPGLPALSAPVPVAAKHASKSSILGTSTFATSKIASKSVPGSRRNSDENEAETTGQDEGFLHRSAGA